MPRSFTGAAISFGLVTIPVKLYSATRSLSPAFHLIHRECGSRIREQLYCPKDERVVSRDELVRGYEIGKDRYVTFTPEELEALEATGARTIEIQQFVPLRTVDPIYFEATTYLGPDRGGDKPYRLLAEVMRDRDEVALGTYVIRGKENLIAIRAYRGGLVLHTLYFADEVRDFGEIDKAKGPVQREETEACPAAGRGPEAAGLQPGILQGHLSCKSGAGGAGEGARQASPGRAARRPAWHRGRPDGRPPGKSQTQDQGGRQPETGPARSAEAAERLKRG